ncbi:hypothetical protein OH491_00470 [Termitidicoccus mucosus]|uniref:hypothetical protein n=1 Tax=Termitidicoccus mucosus TaxID=1184151 RepID=UPI002FEDE995
MPWIAARMRRVYQKKEYNKGGGRDFRGMGKRAVHARRMQKPACGLQSDKDTRRAQHGLTVGMGMHFPIQIHQPMASVFEPRVFVPAFRARALLGAAGGGIEMLAAHAEKGGFAPFVIEKRVVAAIIEYPHREKEGRDKKTIDDHDGDQIHAVILAAEAAGAI